MTLRLRLTVAILGIVAAAVVLIVIFVLLSSGDDDLRVEDVQITVAQITNQVETDRRSSPDVVTGDFVPAQVGQNLSPGDEVKTFADSEARVDMVIRDFTLITRTAPNTSWRLGQFNSRGGTVIELNQGKIFIIEKGVDDGVPLVEVVTPAGTVSPRGTWLSVAYDPETGEAEVQCFRGVCELENELGSRLLTDEQKSTTTAETAPTEPEALDQEETLSFTELPEAKTSEVAVPTPLVVPLTPTPTPVTTVTAPPPPIDTPAPLPSPTLAPTETLLPSPTPTPTPIPTATPPAPTPVALPTLVVQSLEPTSEPAPVPTPTSTPRPTPTLASTPTSTPMATPTPTPVPTLTPTPTPIPTPKPTPTPAPTPTPTLTPTPAPISTPAPLPPVNPNVLPHVFVGTATIDGVSAPDGTVVTAWIQGFVVPVEEGVVSGGNYVLQVPQYGNTSFIGKTVTFKVGGLDAQQTTVWRFGEADVLNLTASR